MTKKFTKSQKTGELAGNVGLAKEDLRLTLNVGQNELNLAPNRSEELKK
jgi:hypothetical protein